MARRHETSPVEAVRRRGTSRRNALTLRTALAAVVIGPITACAGPTLDDGAVRGGPERVPHASVYKVRYDEGRTFTDGYERFLLRGDEPATLDRIELLGGHGYFEIEGVKVAGPDRRLGAITDLPRYPPTRRALGTLTDAPGATLPPGEVGSLFLIGMTVTGSGIGSRSGIRVHYTVDGERFFQDHPAAVVNCPPGSDETACDDAFYAAMAEASKLGR